MGVLPLDPAVSFATGKRGGTDFAEFRYLASDYSTLEAALFAVLAVSPVTQATRDQENNFRLLTRVGAFAEEFEEHDDAWIITVQWGLVVPDDPPATDVVEVRFNFQAPSGQIYQSLSTVNSYAASGTPPDFKGAINVVNDDGRQRVEGINLAPGPETFTLAYFPANAVVSTAYLSTVYNLVGKVNDDTWDIFAAGEIQLVRCVGGARNNVDWSIEFGFSFIQNRDVGNSNQLSINGMTIDKDGHDLLWVYYEDEDDPLADALVKQPTAAYVERVWERGDFDALGLI